VRKPKCWVCPCDGCALDSGLSCDDVMVSCFVLLWTELSQLEMVSCLVLLWTQLSRLEMVLQMILLWTQLSRSVEYDVPVAEHMWTCP
jgi:hypothetical protein